MTLNGDKNPPLGAPIFRATGWLGLNLFGGTDGIRGGDNPLPVPGREHLGKFRAKEKDLGRVINPEQNDNYRPGRAIGSANLTIAQIKTEDELANHKQEKSHQRANPDIPPRDLCIGEIFEDQSKDDGNDHQRHEKVDTFQGRGGYWQVCAKVFHKRRNGCADDEGNEQKKTGTHDHGKGHETILDQTSPAAPRFWSDIPNGVQGILELPKDAQGAEKESNKADAGEDNIGARSVGIHNRGLDELYSLRTDQALDLRQDLLARRRLTEHEAGDGDNDNQERTERKDCVIGQRRAESRGVVLVPGIKRIFEKIECVSKDYAPRQYGILLCMRLWGLSLLLWKRCPI